MSERYYIFKDGTQIGSAATKKAAIDLIRVYQANETHPFLRSNFSMIKGVEEFVPYQKEVKR